MLGTAVQNFLGVQNLSTFAATAATSAVLFGAVVMILVKYAFAGQRGPGKYAQQIKLEMLVLSWKFIHLAFRPWNIFMQELKPKAFCELCG